MFQKQKSAFYLYYYIANVMVSKTLLHGDIMAKKNIQQVIAEAKEHYQKGEINQALKLLEPYIDNKKGQSIIAGIKRRTQEVQKTKNKREESVQQKRLRGYAIASLLGCAFVCIMLMFFTILANNTANNEQHPDESLPIASPTITIYYAKHNNAYLRICERLECPIIEILDFGEAIQVINTVTGDAIGSTTTWYELKRGGYVHALDVLENPPPTPRPVAPYGGSSLSSSSSGSGSSSGFTCPSNCDGAKAMGLTAQQAASCPELDRDHDGVACYGN